MEKTLESKDGQRGVGGDFNFHLPYNDHNPLQKGIKVPISHQGGGGAKKKDRQKSSGACGSVLVVTGQVSMANLGHSSQGKRTSW